MTKKGLQEIMKDNCILECEVDNAIQFVHDLLEYQAYKLEVNEPYATNTIRRLRDAAREVFDLQSCVCDVMEEE